MEGEINILLQSKALPGPRLSFISEMTVSALGSAVPLLEVEGWAFLFSQMILCSDLIAHETRDTPFPQWSKVCVAGFHPQCSMQLWSFTLHCPLWVHAWCWTAGGDWLISDLGLLHPSPESGQTAEPHTCRSCQAGRYLFSPWHPQKPVLAT